MRQSHRYVKYILAQLGALGFAPDPLGNPHSELRLVSNRFRSCDVLRRGDLLGGQAD